MLYKSKQSGWLTRVMSSLKGPRVYIIYFLRMTAYCFAGLLQGIGNVCPNFWSNMRRPLDNS
jgi:hypothetical protein